MAPVIDASTPVRVTGSGTNGTVAVTTGTFSPPASVLVATVQANVRPHGATGAITNNGSALTWTTVGERSQADASAQSGYAGLFAVVLSGSRVGMTVTTTLTSVGGTSAEIAVPSIKLYVVTGADMATPVGAAAEGSSTTNAITTTAFTTVGAASMLFAVGCDWNALGSPVSSDLTVDAFTDAGFNISAVSGYKTLGGSGTSATANLDAAGTGAAAWNWVTGEILAATAVAAPPPTEVYVRPGLAAIQRSVW